MVASVSTLEALRRFVLHERESRFLLFDTQTPVKKVPLACIFSLLGLLLLLLLLCLNSQLLELVTIHLHVRTDDLVSDGCDCLVPVLLLRTVEQALNNDRVSLLDVVPHELLDHVRIKKK